MAGKFQLHLHSQSSNFKQELQLELARYIIKIVYWVEKLVVSYLFACQYSVSEVSLKNIICDFFLRWSKISTKEFLLVLWCPKCLSVLWNNNYFVMPILKDLQIFYECKKSSEQKMTNIFKFSTWNKRRKKLTIQDFVTFYFQSFHKISELKYIIICRTLQFKKNKIFFFKLLL